MASKSQNKPDKIKCVKCKKDKTDKQFYLSNSPTYPDGKYPICKTCILNDIDFNDKSQVQDLLLEMNKPYIDSLWETSIDEGKRVNRHPFGMYLKNIYLNFKEYTWKNSEFNQEKKLLVESNKVDKKEELDYELLDGIEDSQDKKDVIKMLGYDPFEYENKQDQKQMYSRLVDFLDESTLEDGLKLQSVIEIVKGFNQIDKINRGITQATQDPEHLSQNAGGIKSLADTKQKILTSVLKLAEDNGISVKHNNQKSKGAGTLSGIIKQLQEKGFEEAQVNLFDIETCDGMMQVANISNESIMKQLQFDENDYTSMILEQRDIIQDLTNKVSHLEEENRKFKKELMRLKDSESYD